MGCKARVTALELRASLLQRIASAQLAQAENMNAALDTIIQKGRSAPLTAAEWDFLQQLVDDGRKSLAAQRKMLEEASR